MDSGEPASPEVQAELNAELEKMLAEKSRYQKITKALTNKNLKAQKKAENERNRLKKQHRQRLLARKRRKQERKRKR